MSTLSDFLSSDVTGPLTVTSINATTGTYSGILSVNGGNFTVASSTTDATATINSHTGFSSIQKFSQGGVNKLAWVRDTGQDMALYNYTDARYTFRIQEIGRASCRERV